MISPLLHLLGLDGDTRVHRVTDSVWHFTQPPPSWLIVLVAMTGVVLAALNLFPGIGMRRSVRLATVLFRLALTALLLLVLGRLEWRITAEINERPAWTVLLDDSASMATPDVAGHTRFAAARADLERIRRAAGGRVRLEIATLSGAPPEDECGQGPTRFGDALARTALARQQVDRLLLLTDGRDSESRDLRTLGEAIRLRGIRAAVRLYGSPQPPADTAVAAAPERSVLRLGEDLVVRGTLTGAGTRAEAPVRLLENGTEVRALTVPPEAAGRFEFRHRPPRAGRFVYTVECTLEDGVAQDNRVAFTLDVLQEKIKVLMLEGYPRYEFKLFKSVLEVDPLVHLVCVSHLPGGGVYVQGEPLHRNPEQGLIASQAELFRYDVVILRDVSRALFRAGGDATETRLLHLVEFVTKRGGGLVVLGGQDVFRAGGYESSALAQILPFDLTPAFSGKPQFDGLFFVSIPKPAYEHPLLRLLADPAANTERLNSLRQLDGANNVGRFKPLATPLLTRSLELPDAAGRPRTATVPVLGYMPAGEGKVLAAAVDTLWRWQLQSDFDEPPLTLLLANAVRYLAPPPGSGPETPHVGFADAAPQVGQDMVLSTVLRDRDYDPIRNAELVVGVTAPDGRLTRLYPRDLPEDPGYYEYRVRLERPGTYRVAARHGKNEVVREFVAGAAAGEFADLSPDRAGIDAFLEAAGGERIDDLDGWLAAARAEPVRHTAECNLEVWNSPLVLILFLLLVSADCYVRKRAGLA